MAVIRGEENRSRLLAGVDQLANAVRATLGPRGRNVTMFDKAALRDSEYSDRTRPGAPVLPTNDGVTIARAIVVPGAVENMGAQLVREAAIKANDVAGDGTTTAIVLAQELLHGAFRAVAAGADPLAIRRGVKAAGEAALAALAESAVPVDTEDDLTRVATISCQDEHIGALVGKALITVGLEGVVDINDSRLMETTLDIAEGIVFDRELVSPLLYTDPARAVAELENPYILLTDMTISNPQDLIPALMCAAEDGRDCLILADGVEGEALGLVVQNNRMGDMHVACVQAPEYGEGRRWRMDDLAVQTGGMYVSKEMGLSLRDVTRDMLGSAERVVVAHRRTTITGPGGDPQAVADRVAQLRHLATTTEYEFNRKRHAERLAKFVSGVATIRVGGITEAEQRERKMRVEDAVNAASAAYKEGVVPGGGVALLATVPAAEAVAVELEGDERTGARIVARMLAQPLFRIAENAGESGASVVEHVRGLAQGMGYDAASRTYVDMLGAGILDPLAVTRSALEAALSVAGTTLLTDVSVTSVHEEGRTINQVLHEKGVR